MNRMSRRLLLLLAAAGLAGRAAALPLVDPSRLSTYRAALETGAVLDHVLSLAPVTPADYEDALARSADVLRNVPDGDGLLPALGPTPAPRASITVELAAARLLTGTRGRRAYAEGDRVEEGVHARVLGFRSVSLGTHVRAAFAPRLEVGRTATRLRWPAAAVTVSGSGLAVTLGRQGRWWGPGTMTEVLLTTNARAGDGISIGTDGTQRLPLLGPVRAEVLLLRLDDPNRPTANPLLFGHRVAWRPHGVIELGVARTIMLGGDGRTERLTLSDAWDIFLGRRENRPDYRGFQDTDQKVALDGTLYLYPLRRWIPALLGGHVHYRYAGDDGFSGLLPTRVAHLVGGSLLFPRTRVEFERFGNVAGGLWYWNDEYPAGYTVRGDFIGSDVGWDATIARARVTVAASRMVGVRAEFARDTRGHRFHQGAGLEPERGGDPRTVWEGALAITRRATTRTRWSIEWRHRHAPDGVTYDADRATAEHVVRITWRRD